MRHSRDTAGIVPSACGKSCGSHTEGAYSSFGGTSALYARALVFCDAMQDSNP